MTTTTTTTTEQTNEPNNIRMGWYDVRIDYARGHKPAVVDLARLADVLPHGSGIDVDWHVQVRRNGDVGVTGEYHQMDEMGGYNGWVTFRFTLARATRNEYVELKGPCAGQFQVTHVKGTVYLKSFVGGGADNRDYLYEVCDFNLAEMGVHSMESGPCIVNSETDAKAYGTVTSNV